MRLVRTIAATVTGTALLLGGTVLTANAAEAAAPVTLGCSAVLSSVTPAAGSVYTLKVTDAIGNGPLSVQQASRTWANGSLVHTNALGGGSYKFAANAAKGEKVTVSVSGSRGGVAWSCSTAYTVR